MWNFFRRKRQQDSENAVDPICGMTVKKATALQLEQDGQTYYFCSQTCLDTFESQPAG